MAMLNLDIKRFDGEELNFDPAQTAAFVATLNSEVPAIVDTINHLTSSGVNQLVKDWGDGNAITDGQSFNEAYKGLIAAIDAYVNSIGNWAQKHGNDFITTYKAGNTLSFGGGSVSTNVDTFTDKNELGLVGPKNDQIFINFKNIYDADITALSSSLKKIIGSLQSNSHAFAPSVQSSAESTITSENQVADNKLKEVEDAYANYLSKYINNAVAMVQAAKNAAAAAEGN